LKLFSANGKQGPAALINNKQENVNKTQDDFVIKWSGDRIYRNKYNFKRSKADF
jgi:hypothetical protein